MKTGMMGLAGLAMAMALSATTPALAADGGNTIALPAPPPGKGQIVFFRSGTIIGTAMGCSVNENGQKVSSLGAGKYFIMVADPGRHEFTVHSEAKDVLALEVEPDETQFAACKIKMGIMAGRPDIRPATEAEFRAQKNPKMVDADDMGPGPGALRPDQVAAALSAPAPAAPAPVAPSAARANQPAPVGEPAPAE
jgi:hypothetical protein